MITYLQEEMPLDYIKGGICFYTLSLQNTNSYELLLEVSYDYVIVISRHCKVQQVKFMYSKIVIF